MEMKLQVVILPVSDIDKSIAYYRDRLGFNLDHDVQPGNGMRVVQLTPPGSDCSIVFGSGLGESAERGPVKGTHLVVKDISAARQQLIDNEVSISEVNDMGGIKYAFFADPDENTWALQEIGSGATMN